MAYRLDFAWRLFATGFSFSIFGVGGIVLGFIVFPPVHLISVNRDLANRRSQFMVHLSFRLLVWMLRALGVLTYEMEGREKLRQSDANIIVSNHPSLIDIVFIVSVVPHAICAVKKAAWSNPFMVGIMWATGYIPNDEPMQFIEDCVKNVRGGRSLVIFPEGTRSVPGQPLKLRRGAASIIVKSEQSFVPIHITSNPSTLTKSEKWYQIPDKRVHFTIIIGDSIDPQPLIEYGASLVLMNRIINELLKSLLSGKVMVHE